MTCPECNTKIAVKTQTTMGLALQLTLGCRCNANSFTWSTSSKISSHSYSINKLFPVAALITGMGSKKTNELLELLELGSLSREHIRTVYNSFHHQVDVFKDASLERSIGYLQQKK